MEMGDVEPGIFICVQMNDLALKLRIAFVGRLTTSVAMDKTVFDLMLV